MSSTILRAWMRLCWVLSADSRARVSTMLKRHCTDYLWAQITTSATEKQYKPPPSRCSTKDVNYIAFAGSVAGAIWGDWGMKVTDTRDRTRPRPPNHFVGLQGPPTPPAPMNPSTRRAGARPRRPRPAKQIIPNFYVRILKFGGRFVSKSGARPANLSAVFFEHVTVFI